MILIVSCMMVDCHNGNHNYLSSASTIQFDSSWARKMPRSSSASEWAPISHLRAAGAWKKSCTRSDNREWLVLPPWNGSPQLGGGEHEALGHAGAEYVPFPFPIETSEFFLFSHSTHFWTRGLIACSVPFHSFAVCYKKRMRNCARVLLNGQRNKNRELCVGYR